MAMVCGRSALLLLVMSLSVGGALSVSGCRRRAITSSRTAAGRSGTASRTGDAPAVESPPTLFGTAAIPPSSGVVAQDSGETATRPLRRCFSEQPTWADAPVSELLDRAGNLFDGDDFMGALACAEEAARAAPRSVEAHHDRAAALLHLGRLDEARDALALAMALDPDDAETLEASADLYINQLPPTADRSAIGL
ncbi:MAG: tetratricopeptide repeat protein, partial [Polyangia bacterium]